MTEQRPNGEKRIILHLDMNSFFATAEQQDNPRLRGRAIAVGGRPNERSIVAAASVEAKRRGVKTAMSVAEARAVCPSLIVVPGRTGRYQEISRQVTALVERRTPLVEIFSIDECFADLSQRVGGGDETTRWAAAIKIVEEIKGEIRREVGDYLTCSVGLAPNKFLAKLASDRLKPDGLVVVIPASPASPASLRFAGSAGSAGLSGLFQQLTVNELLLSSDLIDFCGLGPRLHRHLLCLGIKTTTDLRRADLLQLLKIFGVVGGQLYQWAWGRDNRPVAPYYQQAEAKSVSHAITLPADCYAPREARQFLFQLCEKVGRRLRRYRLAGRQIAVFVRFTDFSGWGQHATRTDYIQDGREIYQTVTEIWRHRTFFKPIRLVGVRVGLLVGVNQLTLPLLGEEQRRERLLLAQDIVNDRFGANRISRASAWMVKDRQTPATHAFGFRLPAG